MTVARHPAHPSPVAPAKSPSPGPAETPSGKSAADENFPVGSFLLPKAARPVVAAYYAFARATDDIADNPDLSSDDKLARLDGFGAALEGRSDDPAFAVGMRCRDALLGAGVPLCRAGDLLIAFKRDAVKNRTEDWADLMDYCRYSANPVGRFLLDLHGGPPAAYPDSDALCTALQVLNHLQDLKKDFEALDRSYLPGDWLREAGLTAEIVKADAAIPALRGVIDRCLEAIRPSIDRALVLPQGLASRRLAMEAATIARLADRLHGLLLRNDPVAGRVALGKVDFLSATLRGAVVGAWQGGRTRPAPPDLADGEAGR